ncbi:MAG: hypothetical protein Ct9H90mP11_02580 [Acidimicrobiales bacterium]|nr:MAG: hypothetical protein Ct9H90mP11_02580 [Acidimicrobiales bacterium]
MKSVTFTRRAGTKERTTRGRKRELKAEAKAALDEQFEACSKRETLNASENQTI